MLSTCIFYSLPHPELLKISKENNIPYNDVVRAYNDCISIDTIKSKEFLDKINKLKQG